MKIYCCQSDVTWENKDANFARVERLLAGDEPEPGSLVLLPEMFSTGFSMNVSGIREGEARETEGFLEQIAKRFRVFVLGGVVTDAPDGRGYNQALALSPEGRPLARYSKMQPFSLGGETKHYHSGEKPAHFAWSNMAVSPFVCYDLRFPELFRAAAREGAQLFTVIANWPITRIHHWVTLLQARAIENQAYVAGVNRVGSDPRYSYNGRSLIVDPHGTILVEAGDSECVISADIDPALVVNWRAEFPALRDMRP
ncbi:MAG: carbon-nitrogen family hydrolase [Verrucomicrobia subdivision 3 bacterium]|nr:carbon-nitrogen family hydrolase [Limisphaerales bacterium]